MLDSTEARSTVDAVTGLLPGEETYMKVVNDRFAAEISPASFSGILEHRSGAGGRELMEDIGTMSEGLRDMLPLRAGFVAEDFDNDRPCSQPHKELDSDQRRTTSLM